MTFTFSDLSGIDAVLLLETVEQSTKCANREDLDKLLVQLKKLIPFDKSILNLASFDEKSSIIDVYNSADSWPTGWTEHYMESNYFLIDPVVRCAFHENCGYSPWSSSYSKFPPSKQFLADSTDAGLRDGISVGKVSDDRSEFSLLSIEGHIESNERTELILNFLAPHLHQAITTSKKSNKIISLQERDIRILEMFRDGNNMTEIARILGISRNRLYQIFNERICPLLGAKKAKEAVLKATSIGLIKQL